MADIVNFIEQIPGAVWAAIFGSGIALLGAHLSNRGNTNRLIKQLDHDRDEKAKSRIWDLRKQVYLKTVEQLGQIQTHIQKITDGTTEETVQNMAKIQALMADVNGVTLVCEKDVYLKGMKILMELSEVTLRELTNKTELDDAERRQKELLSEVDSENRQLVENGTAIRESSDLDFIAKKKQECEITYSKIKDLLASHTEKTDEIFKFRLACTRKLVANIQAISPLIEELIFAIRKELGMPKIDRVSMRSEASLHKERVNEVFGTTLDFFEQRVSKKDEVSISEETQENSSNGKIIQDR